MTITKTAGLGVGAIVDGATATCPIVQAGVLGVVGGLGWLPFANEYRRALALAVLGCSALALYGVVHVRRRRRKTAAADLRPRA